MKFSITASDMSRLDSSCLILPVDANLNLTTTGKAADRLLDRQIGDALQYTAALKQAGTTWLIPVRHQQIRHVLLAACGDPNTLTVARHRLLIHAIATTLTTHGIVKACSALHEIAVPSHTTARQIGLTILHMRQAFYRFDAYKAHLDDRPTLSAFCFLYTGKGAETLKNVENPAVKHRDTKLNAIKRAITEYDAVAQAVEAAKNLANTPANVCNPAYLAKQAQHLATQHKTVKTQVLDEAAMQKLGMNTFLAVSRGSSSPGKLVVLHYQGASAKQPPTVLVGKGLTFDTGGLNIKNYGGMLVMKYDMCGAATVLALINMAATLALPINVVGVIAAAENHVNRQPTRPGDIVTSMSGKTVEILNTDAEGRLVLADTLTYCRRFDPAVMIDIATLTGATVTSLGRETGCLFANRDRLATDLLAAGTTMDDAFWRLPITDEARSHIKSKTADTCNVSPLKANIAKSLVGAAFLEQFVDEQTPWAHLDVAAVACGETGSSATGRPTALLARYLIDAPDKK